jgi:hypothetical protein
MLTEWELWACAQRMVDDHGADAPIHAAMRADELLENGDQEGCSTWVLIMHRTKELLAGPRDTRH